MLQTCHKEVMYNIQTVTLDSNLSFTLAYENGSKGLPANGGIRIYEYPTILAQESEALTLARHMTLKHHLYKTGFLGAKIVCHNQLGNEGKERLLKVIGQKINQYKGRIYTGCDLNTTDDDMLSLRKITPYILNAMDSKLTVDTSLATAYGVYASLQAITEKTTGRKRYRFLIHGLGKVGKNLAKTLTRAGHIVYGYDSDAHKANISGVMNISKKTDWYTHPCDYLMICSASNIINEDNAGWLACKWIISSSNAPFSSHKVINTLKRKKILWIPDVVSNAGAVICDSIEFNNPDYYKNINPKKLYTTVYNKIYHKTRHLLSLANKYQISLDEALLLFFGTESKQRIFAMNILKAA